MTQYTPGKNNECHYELKGHFYGVTLLDKVIDKVEPEVITRFGNHLRVEFRARPER